MPTAPIKKSPLSFNRTPGEMRRLNQRIVLGIVIVVVGSILIADGFLACRYLQRRDLALNKGCSAGCVPALGNDITQMPVAQPVEGSSMGDQPATLAVSGSTLMGASYEHGAIGIKFRYPSAWGKVKISEESGQASDGSNVIAGLVLSFADMSSANMPAVFAHASNSSLDLSSRDRDYWGTVGAQIKSAEDVQGWCDGQGGCRIFQNSQGLLVARIEGSIQIDENLTKRVYQYYLFNPNSGYSGLVLSSQSLVELGVTDSVGLFEQVVDTVTWVNE